MYASVQVCMCASVRARMCVRACVHICVCAHVCARAVCMCVYLTQETPFEDPSAAPDSVTLWTERKRAGEREREERERGAGERREDMSRKQKNKK
jgi:hypothetical protein